MADPMDITSTTPSVDELKRRKYRSEFESKLYDDAAKYLLETDHANPSEDDPNDIIDLAGGALDAIKMHKSTLPRSKERDVDAIREFLEPTAPRAEDQRTEWSTPKDTIKEKPSIVIPKKQASSTPSSSSTLLSSSSSSTLVDLLYWRDVQKSGVVFGTSLVLLLSLTVCSIVSVVSYVSLAFLSVTVCFRIYKGILQAIQKSEDGHPFKAYLEQEVAVSGDVVHKYSDDALARLNTTLKELRHLFLVEDLVDSLKFAILMWILTYIGALFNGLTLLILGLIVAFTWPVIYEKHQTQIDHYYGLVNNQVKDVMAKIQSKVPGLKPKAE